MARAKSIYDKQNKQCHKSFCFSVWKLLSPWLSIESLMMLNKTRVNILLGKIFIKNYKYCYKGLNISDSHRKRNKAKHVMKIDHCKR